MATAARGEAGKSWPGDSSAVVVRRVSARSGRLGGAAQVTARLVRQAGRGSTLAGSGAVRLIMAGVSWLVTEWRGRLGSSGQALKAWSRAARLGTRGRQVTARSASQVSARHGRRSAGTVRQGRYGMSELGLARLGRRGKAGLHMSGSVGGRSVTAWCGRQGLASRSRSVKAGLGRLGLVAAC
jgi:hypothetical protein